MKKNFLLLLMIPTVSGCGESQDKTSSEPVKAQTTDKKILVVYFSRRVGQSAKRRCLLQRLHQDWLGKCRQGQIGHGICYGCALLTVNYEPKNIRVIFTKEILIKKNTWISARVSILPSVTIGENAFVQSFAQVERWVKGKF